MKNIALSILLIIMGLEVGLCQGKENTPQNEHNPSISKLGWRDLEESEDYVARHECSFVQAGDKFIMFGGRESARRLDIYDYKTDSWSQGAEAPKEFNHFQATSYQGLVWVIGSFKTNNFPKEEPEENIWIYHPPIDRWIKGPEIPKERRRGGAGLVVYDNRFYVIGGNTIGHDGGYVSWFDSYDPSTGKWSILKDASVARDHFSAAVIDGLLYAVAGRKSGGEGGVFAPLPSEVEIYDFESNTWSVLDQGIPTPRAAPGVAVLDDLLYVIGGEGSKHGPAYRKTEIYDPKTEEWKSGGMMVHPRHGTQAIVSGDGIFIAGGSPVRGGGRQHNMEVYGKNEPQGDLLIAGVLDVDNKVKIVKEEGVVVLYNTQGNTGLFINEVSLSSNDIFQLKRDYNNRLIATGDSLSLKVNRIDHSNESCFLTIRYNENEYVEVQLY
ncbi:MAG: hypothetical protein JXR10_13380 [Cyclobacteriaceae bacterium]